MVSSGPEQLLRTISGSMFLLKLGSVAMFMNDGISMGIIGTAVLS